MEPAPTFLQTHVRRTSRNLLLWNGLLAALIVGVVAWGATYWVNFFRGPVPVSDAWLLAAAQNPASGLIAYVELRDRKLLPSGWQEESSQDDKVYEITPYFFLEVGDKLLLVKTHPERDGNRLIGPLQSVHVPTDVKVRNTLLARQPELHGKLLPIMLNGAAAFPVAGYIGLALFTPVFLLCCFNIARALGGLHSPNWHPIARMLARQGDVQDLASQIDREVAAGGMAIGPVTVTEQWLLRPGAFGLIACGLGDIVWVYHLVLNGSSLAVICLSSGKEVSLPLKRDLAPQLVAEICRRIPWVRRGYSGTLLKQWRDHRPEFTAAVEREREAQLMR